MKIALFVTFREHDWLITSSDQCVEISHSIIVLKSTIINN